MILMARDDQPFLKFMFPFSLDKNVINSASI